jgi:hypothetical protein
MSCNKLGCSIFSAHPLRCPLLGRPCRSSGQAPARNAAAQPSSPAVATGSRLLSCAATAAICKFLAREWNPLKPAHDEATLS